MPSAMTRPPSTWAAPPAACMAEQNPSTAATCNTGSNAATKRSHCERTRSRAEHEAADATGQLPAPARGCACGRACPRLSPRWAAWRWGACARFPCSSLRSERPAARPAGPPPPPGLGVRSPGVASLGRPRSPGTRPPPPPGFDASRSFQAALEPVWARWMARYHTSCGMHEQRGNQPAYYSLRRTTRLCVTRKLPREGQALERSPSPPLPAAAPFCPAEHSGGLCVRPRARATALHTHRLREGFTQSSLSSIAERALPSCSQLRAGWPARCQRLGVAPRDLCTRR